MKKLNKYRKSVQGLMLLTFGLTMAGCSAQDDFFTETSSESLSIKPSVTEATVSRAAVASVQTLREAALDNLYVKIFDKESQEQSVNEMLKDNLQSNKKEILGQGNWKVDLNLQENKDYFVYSIANAKENLTQVNSLADLKKKVQTDKDIWKPYSSNKNATKNFLMTANSDWTVSKEPTQTIKSNLTRAAAKIVVNLKINVEGYEVVGEPTWQLLNYNTQTTLFGPNTAQNIASMSETETMAKTADGYQLVTYSYATSWIDNASAPQAKIKVMLRKGEEKPVDYYYSIPVRDPKATGEDAKKLNRNTIYTIDAKINNKGGSSEIGYVTTGKVVYDVLPWSDGGTTDIDANTSYLMVTPKVVYMKNVDTDMSVTYKSSSPVKILSKKVYYIDNENHQENYTEGYVEKYTEKVSYWENKTVQFKPYPTKMELQKEKDGDNLGGKIVINSPIPKNRFSKYIVLTLQNAEGKEATVKYKQSPLIETQNFFGDYSSRSEDNWAYRTAEGTIVKNNRYTYDYNGGYLAKYYDTGSGNIYSFYYGSWNDLSLTNNRMYIIQVSSTKDSKYNIAHPNINQATGYTNDEVVSPAFMIASQLGAVQSEEFDQTKAKEHCETYREVKKENGKQVIYDGWRLPTKTEIQFIVDFQKESFKRNDNKEIKPIKPVLEGAKYYTLNKESVKTGYSGSGTFVRCVRDLTPKEVEELDKQMK